MSDSLRVLFIADVPPNPDSGASGTEYQTARALREAGHEVDPIWWADLPHRIAHGNLHKILEQPRGYRHAMVARLRQRQYDVAHVNQPQGYLAARTIRTVAPNTAFVHRSHGFEARARAALKPWALEQNRDARSPLRRAATRILEPAAARQDSLICKYADGHIVSASECKEFIAREYGVSEQRIAVIPQAPPVDYLSAPAPPMSPERASRLLYVGQFAFFKGPHVLAKAVARLLTEHPAFSFTWVCAAEHHAAARAMLGDGEFLDRVRFHDWLPQRALMDVYDSHGLFLFPSLFEGFGKAPLEAMARGLVVVAARNGGMKDFISDQRNGRLVTTGSAVELVDACLDTLSSPDRLVALSRAARDDGSRYQWSRVASETSAFYRLLIELRAARGVEHRPH